MRASTLSMFVCIIAISLNLKCYYGYTNMGSWADSAGESMTCGTGLDGSCVVIS
jgi:hypothetical protein